MCNFVFTSPPKKQKHFIGIIVIINVIIMIIIIIAILMIRIKAAKN